MAQFGAGLGEYKVEGVQAVDHLGLIGIFIKNTIGHPRYLLTGVT
jgi:hypothetical protein